MANLVDDPRYYDNPAGRPDLPRAPLGKTSYINCTLSVSGASEQLWDADPSEMEAGFTVDLTTDKDCFLAFNVVGGTPDATDSLELLAGESYNPSVLVLFYSIRFVNKNPDEVPHIRGAVWGV